MGGKERKLCQSKENMRNGSAKINDSRRLVIIYIPAATRGDHIDTHTGTEQRAKSYYCIIRIYGYRRAQKGGERE